MHIDDAWRAMVREIESPTSKLASILNKSDERFCIALEEERRRERPTSPSSACMISSWCGPEKVDWVYALQNLQKTGLCTKKNIEKRSLKLRS